MAEAADELWRFSLGFYDRPGVAEALIALQDHRNRDVNLILFALWCGISGRGRLDAAALAAAERAVQPIRAKVTEPLRALRRNLKAETAEDLQQLRTGIKALELDAERLAQRRLAALAPDAALPTDGRLADGLANLELYIGSEAEAAVIREALEGFT